MAQLAQSLCLPNREATLAFGQVLGRSLPAGSVLLLKGDLGSGKTTLVQGLGAGLGITAPIVSPTFILVQEYGEGRLPLYHLDLYRLKPQDMVHLAPDAYWSGLDYPPGIVAIEWPERLLAKPPDYLAIRLDFSATGEARRLELRAEGTGNFKDLAKIWGQLTEEPKLPR